MAKWWSAIPLDLKPYVAAAGGSGKDNKIAGGMKPKMDRGGGEVNGLRGSGREEGVGKLNESPKAHEGEFGGLHIKEGRINRIDGGSILKPIIALIVVQ